ncbi:hypothetical protein N7451_004740 [Penicillium sp. IBT 35674x]|nr:hypothetical protein N7451_004740 [Penicillium sp. IBT 35674x]
MFFNLKDQISKLQDFELSSPYIFYGVVICALCYWWKATELKNPSGLPVIGRRWYELGNGRARQRFRDDCLGIVRSCLKEVSNISIPMIYADMIRNETRLDFNTALADKLVNGVHGFEAMESMTSETRIVRAVTKHSLTRHLGTFIEPLNEESDYALREVWTDDPEFHDVMLKDCVWKLFGQIMSRTFINEKDFYRNPEWVHASSDWKMTPKNPLSFLNQKLEGQLDELGSTLIALCLVSYDGGGELFTHVLHSVWRNEQLISDLRSEIVNVVGNEGFNKNTLQNLVLMDSVLKEAQRMHPESVLQLQRIALEEVVLPDGLIIPKGTPLLVSGCHMLDASVWPNGDKFDGYRFFNLRQKADSSTRQASYNFTSTSPDHFGFGHGSQACPGRFFASYMQKILLCHVIMKYDVLVTIPEEGAWFQRGSTHVAHPGLKARVRRRREEIQL